MKTTFASHWGWSKLSEWGGGDRFPDAVELPDGTKIDLTLENWQGIDYQFRHERPGRTRATYTPMNSDGTVRLRHEGGGSSGGCSAGQRWARMTVLCPRGSSWLYGGHCRDCGAEMPQSDDPESPVDCAGCREHYAALQGDL